MLYNGRPILGGGVRKTIITLKLPIAAAASFVYCLVVI